MPEGLREKMRKYDCLRERPLLFPHSCSQAEDGPVSEAPGRRHVENVFISENKCDIAVFIMHQNTVLLLLIVYMCFFSQNTVIGVPGKVLVRFFIKNSKIVSFEKERIFLFSSSLSADTAHI